MATVEKLLMLQKYRRVLAEISVGTRKKMSCSEVRIAVQLQEAGVVKLVSKKRNNTYDSWMVTDTGQQYVI